MILPGRLRIAAAFGLPVRCPPAYPGPAEALAWFDTELPSLLAAQQLAAHLKLDHLAVAVLRCDLGVVQPSPEPCRLAHHLRSVPHRGPRVRGCPRRSVGRLPAGRLPRRRPRPDRRRRVADYAIRTAWLNGDRAGEGSAREQRGNAALAAENFDEAIEHYTRGLACWRRVTEHQRAVALLERQLGRAHAGRGDYREADTHLTTSLTIFDGLGERYHAARTRYAIAVTRLADPAGTSISAVLDLLDQAQPMLEAEDHPLHLSELLTAQAEAHIRAGNTGQARACTDKAEAIQQELHLPDSHHARAYLNRVTAQLASSASDA